MNNIVLIMMALELPELEMMMLGLNLRVEYCHGTR